MKITVDSDRLHKVFMKAVDLKHDLEGSDHAIYQPSEAYQKADYVTGELASIWFQGTQEAKDLIKRKEEANRFLITPEELMEIIDKGQKFYAKKEEPLVEDNRPVAGEDIESNRFVYMSEDGKIYQSISEANYLNGLKDKLDQIDGLKETPTEPEDVKHSYFFDDELQGKRDENRHNILAILDFLVRLLKLDNTMTPNRQRSLRSDLYIDITDLKEEILGAKR